jgi:hypothetical protein
VRAPGRGLAKALVRGGCPFFQSVSYFIKEHRMSLTFSTSCSAIDTGGFTPSLAHAYCLRHTKTPCMYGPLPPAAVFSTYWQ